MKVKSLLLAAVLSIWATVAFAQQTASNGVGSTTHSGVTTAYTGGQLFALNTTGNAVASPIVLGGVQNGQSLAIKAVIYSTGTNKPGTSTLWLFTAPPTTTELVDRSAYVGPYLADFQANIYLGSLTCANWQTTNDSSAKYFSECSGSSLLLTTILPQPTTQTSTTIYALEEVGAYTPIASEVHTYLLSTLRSN